MPLKILFLYRNGKRIRSINQLCENDKYHDNKHNITKTQLLSDG